MYGPRLADDFEIATMNKLKIEFMTGFQQGWTLFWSPFVGFKRTFFANWCSQLKSKR